MSDAAPPSDDRPPPGWSPPPQPYQPYQQPARQPYQPYQQPPYQPYGQAYPYAAYPAARTEGMAIAGLICAIGSFVVCIPILAIVALPLASTAKAKINGSGGRLTGLGLITASRWLAGINLAIWGLIIGLTLVSIAIDVSSTPTSEFDTFERFVP